MRKTEVYQVRLDSQEKKQAFAVFKQLGITPAQAVRLFFKQVVLTKSIPIKPRNRVECDFKLCVSAAIVKRLCPAIYSN